MGLLFPQSGSPRRHATVLRTEALEKPDRFFGFVLATIVSTFQCNDSMPGPRQIVPLVVPEEVAAATTASPHLVYHNGPVPAKRFNAERRIKTGKRLTPTPDGFPGKHSERGVAHV